MTNLEWLAQNPELVTDMIFSYCEKRGHCEDCPFDKACDEHFDTEKDVTDWLEQDRGMPWEDIAYEKMRAKRKDMQEVIHAKWVEVEEDVFECSNCRRCRLHGHNIPKPRYCGQCGAKMDGAFHSEKEAESNA